MWLCSSCRSFLKREHRERWPQAGVGRLAMWGLYRHLPFHLPPSSMVLHVKHWASAQHSRIHGALGRKKEEGKKREEGEEEVGRGGENKKVNLFPHPFVTTIIIVTPQRYLTQPCSACPSYRAQHITLSYGQSFRRCVWNRCRTRDNTITKRS